MLRFRAFSAFVAVFIAGSLSAVDANAETAADFAPFRVMNGADHVIALDGPIDFRAPLAFRRILAAYPETKGILLNSAGGSVQGALLIAEEVHEKKLATIVLPGTECMSACSFVFFAGDARLAGGSLGVHQMSGSADLKNAQLNLSDVLETLAKYGVHQGVITRMLRTPPESMYVFSQQEVVELGINRDRQRADTVSAPAAVQAVPTPQPLQQASAVSVEQEQAAKKFVLSLIAAGSLSKAGLIDLSGRVYSDPVEFYGKQLTRREIIEDKAKYAEK
ncbi:hypothetical protein MUU53_16550 [Rhizobium lemnae]|uniref:Uncharacterized protein n=1 Tax=Rhizobium lemnae TaxID=1214924 RepID=A0ABV8E8K3_9HYPH|nr:hypothetical protein [Rhizobium lemnae]MCJ8509518.1 hypothetical protein [Rhizobium lemnae]